jgi:polyhydroxyalkanoate synthesis repressor PhaR
LLRDDPKPTKEETSMREIRRYSNRKLYDTEQKHYVTLSDLCRVIREGTEIKVVDRDTQQDITSVILAEIIHVEEKRDPRVPVADLVKIIRTGKL